MSLLPRLVSTHYQLLAAIEYGPGGIISNVITPGFILDTEGMERLGNRDDESAGSAFKGILLQRYGTVKEIADRTVYLFSDTGNYINGEVLVIDDACWRLPSTIGGLQYPGFLLDDSFPQARTVTKSKM